MMTTGGTGPLHRTLGGSGSVPSDDHHVDHRVKGHALHGSKSWLRVDMRAVLILLIGMAAIGWVLISLHKTSSNGIGSGGGAGRAAKGGHDPSSLNVAQPGLRHTSVRKSLVVYVYWEKDESYKDNLEYFLKYGVHESETVDYVFVINGPYTATFPEYKNVKLVPRENKCFDFGSWFVGLQSVKHYTYSYYFFMNTSVRGPFLPSYLPAETHWTQLFINKLSDTVKLVGLTVNCPDGVGRRIPHLQSMFFVLDRVGLNIALRTDAFRCPPSKQQSLYAEGTLSLGILEAGYNLDVVQLKYSGIDWRKQLALPDPCEGISLDVFLGPGKYDGETVHPLEMVFMKTNREGFANIVRHYTQWSGARLDKEAASSALQLAGGGHGHGHGGSASGSLVSAEDEPLKVHLVTHNLEMQGAPLVLFQLSQMLLATGRYSVSVSSLRDSQFRHLWEEAGIPVKILSGHVRNQVLDAAQANDVILLNTIIMAPLLVDFPKHLVRRVVWAIHESERDVYEAKHKELGRALYGSVARLLFVSHATRAVYSEHDYGNFETIYNWIDTAEVLRKVDEHRGMARANYNLAKTDFIITSIGTLCPRKDQMTLLKAGLAAIQAEPSLANRLRIMLIGMDGTLPDYEASLKQFAASSGMSANVIFVPVTTNIWPYLADANMHVSTAKIESLPLNVMEAMAARVPVVAAGVFGVVELITNKVDGILVQPEDSVAVSAAIVQAATARGDAAAEWTRMAKAGASTMRTRFSPQKALKSYMQLFNKVAVGWKRSPPSVNKVCIVVRTFYKHAHGIYNLDALLHSLQRQERENWEALVFRTDDTPFPDLPSIIGKRNDARIRLMELGDHKYVHKQSAYKLTDELVSHCSPEASWVLITNGDNTYHPSFLSHADSEVDIVAYNWYTRYMYSNDKETRGDLCSRWRWGQCKSNIVRYWHTDLGANLLNLKRWRAEKRLFHLLPADSAQDSRMIEKLVYDEWKVKHVHTCLFHHNPNPVSCHELGMVWNDNQHECITQEEGQKLVDSYGFSVYTKHQLPFTCIDRPWQYSG